LGEVGDFGGREMKFWETVTYILGCLIGLGVALFVWTMLIFMWAKEAKADSPRTYLCTSKQFANIYGRKRCGPHKARLVLKEGIAASYKGFSKSYQRKVLRSYECKEVSGI
jgi:hypothetical protein